MQDYSGKLVLCLRNRSSFKEQIFSLNLDSQVSAGFIKFHAHVQNLFSKNGNKIYTLRIMKIDSFEDILGSYNSIESKILKNQSNNSFEQSVSKKTKSNRIQTPKKYTVFSFVKLKSQPFMKIKKKPNLEIIDDHNLHIKVTNFEGMKSFFVNIDLKAQCKKNKNKNKIRLMHNAKYELDYLNEKKSIDSNYCLLYTSPSPRD